MKLIVLVMFCTQLVFPQYKGVSLTKYSPIVPFQLNTIYDRLVLSVKLIPKLTESLNFDTFVILVEL